MQYLVYLFHKGQIRLKAYPDVLEAIVNANTWMASGGAGFRIRRLH